MPTTEEAIQKTVVSLEAGALARWIWRAAFTAAVLGLLLFYLFHEFRGISMPQAMDQAQIGREIDRGHGFATKFARPMAMWQLARNGRDVRTAVWQDTYNAPLACLLDAAAVYIPVANRWEMTRGEMVYPGDRAIAALEAAFFLGSIWVLYLMGMELFDQRLAFMACGLVLVCDSMWNYALSGLPQMWLLLLLNASLYVMVRAMRAHYLHEPLFRWLAGAGLLFGLLALSHAITIWLFVPAILFSFLFFRPRLLAALAMLGPFLALYVPWLVRNAMVCGDPRGLAIYSMLDGIQHTEAGHMRRLVLDLKDVSGSYYFENFRKNLAGQIDRLIENMGWSCVAPLFFVSLLHVFKRPVTAMFRWLLLVMWIGAVLGMGVFGMKEDHGLMANQLHLLFVPLFICYGLAYILVQWDRRIGLAFLVPEWNERHHRGHKLLRRSIVGLIFFLSGLPLLGRLLFPGPKWLVHWPPYLPPYISMLREWIQPDQIIGSDMPWAVAWYADRKSLWLPPTPGDLIKISDYHELGGTVSALYLTPISGTENILGDLVSGDYEHWAGYIVRDIDLNKTPYHWRSPLGMPECVYYGQTNPRAPKPAPGK